MEMHEIQYIDGVSMRRRVPGGWNYTEMTGEGGFAVCFVPDPTLLVRLVRLETPDGRVLLSGHDIFLAEVDVPEPETVLRRGSVTRFVKGTPAEVAAKLGLAVGGEG